MDERTIREHSGEVILTYAPDLPQEVVLSYEAPLPEGFPPPERVRHSVSAPFSRRRRRGRVVLAVLAAILAVTVAVGLGLFFFALEKEPQRPTVPSGDELFPGLEELLPGEEETAIPTYPSMNDFRLSLSEDRTKRLSAQKVYETVSPSVVSVVTYLDGGRAALGTGFIFSESGYIVTNYHVIEGGRECALLFSDNFVAPAKLVGYDEAADLAVLKTEPFGYPAVTFGSSDLLTVGDDVYAIGSPLGLKFRGTFTDGIVSAINRDVTVDGVTKTLIQTNAALNSGNSGGPLINEYGQVVGINVIKMVSNDEGEYVEGLGFAIPSSTVAHIVNCIIATGEITEEPILGITVRTVKRPNGASELLVDGISAGYGGERADVRPGDIILAADGEPIDDGTDLIRCRRRYQAGESLPLTILRGMKTMEVQVELMIP